jgi:beta-phosphoglucomutase-like phosphatase (HAD superfamily)
MQRFLSLDDAGVFRVVIATRGRTLSEEDVRGLVATKAARFMDLFGRTFRTFPGAEELVDRRAKLGPVGIVSGAFRAEIAFALDRMGVADRVSFIVSAESVRAPKPDPAPFEAAVKELAKIGGAESHGGPVVVEDSPGGVRSAKKAGLRCVAVTHSRSADELRKAGADAVVDNLAALTDALLDGSRAG